MSNLEDIQWYKNVHNGCTLVFVTVTILSFSVGIVQYHRTFTYVPTYCLVKRSFLEKCNTRYTKYESSPQRCLVPIWLVEYEDSGKSEQTTIIDPMFWVDRDSDSNQPDSLKKYEIGGIYRCYHSNHMRRVQWKKPNSPIFIGLMICGTISTLFCILLLLSRCRNRRGSNNVHRNSILQHTPPLPRVLPTVSVEEDVLVTPPPPYTPSIASEEEENNPITPPPPYTPSIASAEQENIPLTPPPAYVPSSI